MARAFLPMFVCILAVAAAAQGTPESALAELALSPDLKSASKHYPEALTEVLAALPARDMAVAQQKLLPMNLLSAMSVHPKASEDGKSFLLLENAEKKESPVELTHHISDGVNAMIELQACTKPELCFGSVQAWMRLEDGDWRLVEIDRVWGGGRIKLDDPDFIDSFRNAERNENEKQALQAVQRIAISVVNYASVFPDVGLPDKLSVLGADEKAVAESTSNELAGDVGTTDDEPAPPPDPEHAGMLDAALAKTVCEISGYKIEYTLTRHGSFETGAYTITAMPIRFGETGIKSFFADESGEIRMTREDRAANQFDGTAVTMFQGRRR